MQHIKDYRNFYKLNEEENPSYSPLDAYMAVALGISRAFTLLSYFYAIAKPDADPFAWKAAMKGIAAKKDYEGKWNAITETADEILSAINKYAAKRRTENVNVGKFFDVGVVASPISNAIQKFKQGSDILTKQLKDQAIKDRLLLLDKALPLDPYRMTESSINEAQKSRRTPTEAEVLNLADLLRASVTQMLTTAREMKELFPDSKSFVNDVVSKYVTPASVKIQEILNSNPPDDSMQLSKSVRKSYEDKGWVLKTVRDKYLIDQYEDLIDLQDELNVALDKIKKAKDNVIKELAPRSDAGEFVDAGNRILDSVESKVQEKEKIEDLRRRANLMLPIAKDQPLPTQGGQVTQEPKTTTGSGYVNPDELRKLLQRRTSK